MVLPEIIFELIDKRIAPLLQFNHRMRQENSTLLISNSKSTIHWKTTAYPFTYKVVTKKPITAAFRAHPAFSHL
jgi:hypothetical protein